MSEYATPTYSLQNGVYRKNCEPFDVLSELTELRATYDEQLSEIERLNQMLRDTGYGQGAIDAYAAQDERAANGSAQH